MTSVNDDVARLVQVKAEQDASKKRKAVAAAAWGSPAAPTEPKILEPPAEPEIVLDLDAVIGSHTDALVQPDSDQQSEPVKPERKKKPKAKAKKRVGAAVAERQVGEWIVPEFTRRAHDADQRTNRAFEIPQDFLPLRQAAEAQSMGIADLILGALDEHRAEMLAIAESGTFPMRRLRSMPIKRWTPRLTDKEVAMIDAFKDELGTAIQPATSRRAVIIEALYLCRAEDG